MTYLTFNSQLRRETDAGAIATLKRRGWTEAPQPTFDTDTQACEWVNGAWAVRDLTADELAAAYKARFPYAKMWQVKVWLTRNGIDVSTVPAMFESLPTPAAVAEAKIRWEQVPDVPRDHPLTAFLGAALGMTSEQIDAAWPDILAIS